MKTRAILLFIILFSPFASVPVNGAVVLESAWVEALAAASASNGGITHSSAIDALGGLGVSTEPTVSASVPDVGLGSAFASATATAYAQFDGVSTFSLNVGISTTTSAGYIPSAACDCQLIVDFLVQGQNSPAPIWSTTSGTFIRKEGGNPTGLGPEEVYVHQNGTGYDFSPGALLAPGSYTAHVHYGWLDNDYSVGGTSFGSSTGSFVFGPAGLAVGFNQANPILPQSTAAGGFSFTNAPSAGWFDPATASGYDFQTTDGSKFTDILSFPSGFNGNFTVAVGGQAIGTFGAGQSVNFKSLLGTNVSEFEILGISPTVDGEDPQAFPIQLAFTTGSASFTMSPLPEPSTWATLAAGTVSLLALRRRKHK